MFTYIIREVSGCRKTNTVLEPSQVAETPFLWSESYQNPKTYWAHLVEQIEYTNIMVPKGFIFLLHRKYDVSKLVNRYDRFSLNIVDFSMKSMDLQGSLHFETHPIGRVFGEGGSCSVHGDF